MGLTLVTPPALPLSLAEAKLHLRVDYTDDDSLILACIDSATKLLDGYDGILGRCLMPQTWELHYDSFPSNEIIIPLPPLIDVNFIKYYDGDGVQQTLSTTDYAVDNKSTYGYALPVGGWPATHSSIINAVQINFQAGYATGVPASLKQAILQMVGDFYQTRQSIVVGRTVAETLTVQRLVGPYRLIL